ncbi:MAG: ABC transporter permease [Myxococcaceae bacterium]|nr:ABC transporter permease [Myxococcaceae bacterium]
MKRVFHGALPSLLSIALALAICFVALALSRSDVHLATDAYAQMIFGGVGDFPSFTESGRWGVLTRPWGESTSRAALLLLTGLSVAVAFSVGLFNIGAQGQMTVGALLAAVVGAHVSLPAGIHPLVGLLCAALAGAAYGSIAAVLKVRRGVHEVISTIMLNWIAVNLIENWLVTGPLRAHSEGTVSIAGTDQILPTAELPRLLSDGSRIHLGFPIAVLIALALWAWLSRLRHGFETRAVGLGPEAARTAGIPVERRIYQAMALSGALAGLAGGVLVLGTEFRFPAVLGAPYGFDGIAIALIGQNHPIGVAVSALFFGILRAGGTRMQLLGVHKSFPELIQGLALLFVAARYVWRKLLSGRAARPSPRSSEVQRA